MLISRTTIIDIALSVLVLQTSVSTRITTVFAQSFVPKGIQSGPSGSTFPGSAVFKDNTLSIAGAVYTSTRSTNCFYAKLQLGDNGDWTWLHQKQFTNSDGGSITEACTAIALFSDKTVLAGYTDSLQGVLEGFGIQKIPSGTLVSAKKILINDDAIITDGDLLDEKGMAAVQYPIAMDTLQISDTTEATFVVSQTTNDVSANVYDTMVNPIRFFPYGGSGGPFNMTTRRILHEYNSNGQYSRMESWATSYSLSINNAPAPIYPSGILALDNNVLVIVGSTAGQGGPFGVEPIGTDLDGFVDKFDGTTGNVYSSGANNIRIQSMDNKDDWIMGACNNAQVDPNHIYIVGHTAGLLTADADDGTSPIDSTDAFLMKLTLDTLEVVYTVQLSPQDNRATGSLSATSCAVTPDGQEVWFGGNAYDNAVLTNADVESSFGGDDAFLVKVNAQDGTIQFRRQMGTSANDRISPRTGGLTTDAQGNAIITGHTFGSFYRLRNSDESSSAADIFVASVSRSDGSYAPPGTPGGSSSQQQQQEEQETLSPTRSPSTTNPGTRFPTQSPSTATPLTAGPTSASTTLGSSPSPDVDMNLPTSDTPAPIASTTSSTPVPMPVTASPVNPAAMPTTASPASPPSSSSETAITERPVMVSSAEKGMDTSRGSRTTTTLTWLVSFLVVTAFTFKF